jgi:hypothetical protein
LDFAKDYFQHCERGTLTSWLRRKNSEQRTSAFSLYRQPEEVSTDVKKVVAQIKKN